MNALLTAILVTLLILFNPSLINGDKNVQSTSSKIKYITQQNSDKKELIYTMQTFNGVTYFTPDYFKTEFKKSKQGQSGNKVSIVDYEMTPYIGITITVATIPISPESSITLKQYLKDWNQIKKNGKFFKKDGCDWYESSGVYKHGIYYTNFSTVQNKKFYFIEYAGRYKEYKRNIDVFKKFMDSITFSNLTY